MTNETREMILSWLGADRSEHGITRLARWMSASLRIAGTAECRRLIHEAIGA